jgi:hypothetical protein
VSYNFNKMDDILAFLDSKFDKCKPKKEKKTKKPKVAEVVEMSLADEFKAQSG